MKASVLQSVLLVILWVVVPACQVSSDIRHRKVFQAGEIEATRKTRDLIPPLAVLGTAALAAGLILIATGARRR